MSDTNEKTALVKQLTSENALLRSQLKKGQQAAQKEQARTSRLLAESVQHVETLQQEIAGMRALMRGAQNARAEQTTGYLHRQKNRADAQKRNRLEHERAVGRDMPDADTIHAGPLRILIADAYPLVREGLAAILAREADMHVAGQAHSGQDAFDLYSKTRPDMLLMETDLPDWKGDSLITALAERHGDCCVLVFSHNAGEEAVESALRAGAKGYLSKDASREAIVAAIRLVIADQRALAAHVRTAQAIRGQRQGLAARALEASLLPTP